MTFLLFPQARSTARRLGCMSAAEYKALGSAVLREKGLPTNPNLSYPEWAGWVDWLGNEERAANLTSAVRYLPFAKARHEARKLGLGSLREWKTWARENRTSGLPVNPDLVYEGEFTTWTDWLGIDPKTVRGDWRKFEDAATWARKLGFTTKQEWIDLVSSGKLPPDVPSKPDLTYRTWRGDPKKVLLAIKRGGLSFDEVDLVLGRKRGSTELAVTALKDARIGRGSNIEVWVRLRDLAVALKSK